MDINARQIAGAVLGSALMLGSTLTARAQDERDFAVGIEVEAAVVTQYMWRGYDVLGNHAAFQPGVTLSLGDTGFSIGVWGSFSLSGGYENNDELNYIAEWTHRFFEGDFYATDATVSYVYYDYPNQNRYADEQEVSATVAFPSMFCLGGSNVVPSYQVAKLWPNKSHSGSGWAGWFHILGLSYDLNLECPLRDNTVQTISLAAEAVYNDGVYGADSDWSHAVFSVSVPFEFGAFTITPAVNYQITMDKSVNDDKNEFWGGLTLGYSF